LGDFRLQSGEVIRDAFVAYRTFGRLNEARSKVGALDRPQPAETFRCSCRSGADVAKPFRSALSGPLLLCTDRFSKISH
jgi:hypothetical protein